MTPIDPLRETLAALCHEQWSGWMQYLFRRAPVESRAGAIITAEDAARWKRQMQTPYSSLSPVEQESDRIEADRILAAIMACRSCGARLLADGEGGWSCPRRDAHVA